MSHPYSLVPIASAIILFYLISLALVKAGIYSRNIHWRFWNTLLLITFIFTGILGILLVIQINYKIEMPWIHRILKWHVNFGTGMTFIAFIHLFKHLRYYKDVMIHKPDKLKAGAAQIPKESTLIRRDKVILALIVLGLTTLFSQMVIIREFLNVFQGNELIIGLIMCFWMLLTALGSRLGLSLQQSGDFTRLTLRLLLLEGILPSVTVLMMVLLENQLFPPGTAKGLVPVMAFCLGLLSPCCIISGILFTLLASAFIRVTGENRISQAYGWESLGSMAAGVLFGLLLAYLMSSFQILAWVMLLNVVAYIWILPENKKQIRTYLLPSLLIVAAGLLFFGKADHWARSIHYVNQKVIYTHDTPYGNVTVTSTAGQKNFYENGNLFFSTENNLVYEEAVHYALLQRQEAHDVLIVSGGIGGMTEQVLKYRSVRHIDYLEVNPWLVKAEKDLSNPMIVPLVNVVSQDARKWIKTSGKIYDAVVINTPDPANAQINRYYTFEFFREIKQALTDNGVLSISLSPTVNYISDDATIVNSILYQTLKKVFINVEIITGERNYFIASDSLVRIDLAKCVQSAGIKNDYVTPYYLDDDLIAQNNRNIMRRISDIKPAINKDLLPLAYFHQIHYWISIHENMGLIIPIIALLLLFLFIALRNVDPVSIGVFTTGFAGASAEFLLLMIFQIIFGYIYQTIGVIIGFYMMGLVIATIIPIDPQSPKLKHFYVSVQLVLMLFIMLIPWVVDAFISHKEAHGWVIQAFLFIVVAAIAMAAGLTFNMASHMETKSVYKTAGNLYATDLAGAAGGTLLISMICFPVFGLNLTCLLISVLVAFGIMVNLLFYRPISFKIH